MKILIVDDNEQNLYMLRVLLEGHGHRVISAGDGAQALEKARREPPQLIVTDILMPVMDGFVLCREWRRDERLKDIPFVFYTATYTDPKDEEFALSLGADKFIIKPAEPKGFMKILQDIFDASDRPEAVEEPPAEDGVYLKKYNETLIRKLESKMQQLEAANRELERRVTLYKKAQEAQRESEERFRRTFEQAAVGICHVSPEGRYLRVNKRFCEIVGYSHTELMGRTYRQITHPDDQGIDLESMKKLVADEIQSFSLEKRYLRKDQSSVWVNLTVSLVRGNSGEAKYFIAVVEDISKRKKTEEEKESLQRQLLQSQKMEAVGQLAGGMAHDFNNMLSVIMGFAHLGMSVVNPGDFGHEEFEKILAASERVRDLTSKVLTFARQKEIHVTPESINLLVGDLAEMLKRSFSKTIKIDVLLESGLPAVRIDATQIYQSLLNVCGNARDAMPDGGELTIETKRARLDEAYCQGRTGVEPGDYCLIQISDTGSGIPKENLQKIFEPFFTTKEEGKGTGLGLSTTFGIVKNHGGHINVYSEAGKGTAFRIFLPFAEANENREGAAHLRSLMRGDETILVVDDEPQVLQMAENALKSAGYTPIACARGANAVEIYKERSQEIDLVLVDIVMPEMDGAEVCRALREFDPRVKIVICSGYSAESQAKNIMAQGLRNFVQKPFDLAELCAAIRRELDG